MPLVDTVRGTFLLALPLILGALAGVLVRALRRGQRGDRGPVADGRVRRRAGRHDGRQRLGRPDRGGARRRVHLAAAGRASPSATWSTRSCIGIVLNLLALGLTGFLYERLMQTDQQTLQPAAAVAATWEIPVLSDIPVIGPVLFRGNIFLYLALILVVVHPHRAVPDPVGPAHPVGRRAPDGGRHGRHHGCSGCATATCCWPALVAGHRRRLLHAAARLAASPRT